jgi:signal transduction histidine kinase
MELYPKILQDWGLEAAVCRRVDELNAANSIHVALQIEGDIRDRLPTDLELALYRVAQEALNNIARHSRAQYAQVILKREAREVTLEIQDDGIGFNTALMQREGSYGSGLAGMRERLALIGGEVMIESHVGHGTRIVARAPLGTPSFTKEGP